MFIVKKNNYFCDTINLGVIKNKGVRVTDNSIILDNTTNKKVVDFIKDKINNNFAASKKSNLNIVSAYFTIYAFNKLKKELTNKVSHTNFILGEPSSIENLGLKDKRLKVFKIQDENISLEKAITQNAIAKECYNWLKSSNVQIRTAPKKENHKTLIHGKMYYIEQDDNSRVVDAIVGSSNFTSNGLGINECSNYELNTIIDSKQGINELKEWFDNLWENNTEDAKKEILKYIEALYKENTPELVYMKTLYEMFSDELDKSFINVETNKKFTDTILWKDKLFQFQKDAVNSIVKKLDMYNGCILADSVGLGKTYTALGVIQYYICSKKPNILVLAPKRLENNWKRYEDKNIDNPFKEDGLKIYFRTHTDLTSENKKNKTFDWGAFDLVVIDESHNFRNATGSKIDENGNIIKLSRYDKLMNDIIKNGSRQPKVLLLSATPVNTSLIDLKNQIRLIDLDNDYAFKDNLDIPSVNGLIKVANKKYVEWAKSKYRNKDELLEKLDAKFVNLLSNLTISRSRKQIKNYYQSDDLMNKIPKRKKPISIYKDIDLNGEFPTYEQLNAEIEEYSLSLYKPTNFVIRNKEKYNKKGRSTMTQERREDYLIGMMKMGFLKRLESSIASFTLSMEHILNNIDQRLAQIEMSEKSKDNFVLEYKNDEPIYTYEDDEDDEIDYTVGKKLVFDIRDLDTIAWKAALRKDRIQIEKIYKMALTVTADRDAKLKELKDLIEYKSKQDNKKLIVFASYSDTADYLYRELKEYAHNTLGLNIALVTGNKTETTYGSSNFDAILENFAPEAKLDDYNRPKNEQIDILVCTDCISEGQNLQDCDTVVNYDIHWNPVRLIQRFGRIDRIGSNNAEIQMISFWPTKDLEHYIKLQYRVEARMALADQTTTTDDYILEEQDLEFAEKNELSFREKQIKKLMAEEPLEDIEDSSEDFTLSDISMEDFYTDLTSFTKSQNDKLEQLPLGLNAIIPNKFIDKTETERTMPAGIIFCLKQKHSSEDNKRVNKFQPYYLVYIKNDGSMYLSYEKGKHILDIYRTLCLGKNVPYQELCDIFNKKLDVENGLEIYNQLLKTSVNEITKSYQKDIVKNVFSRGAFIPTMEEQVKCGDDFELISWLIISEEANVN